MTIMARVQRVIRAATAVGVDGHVSVNLHGVSYEDAAALVDAGFALRANTVHSSYDGWSTWHSLTMDSDGASVNAFTQHRRALDWEIERECGGVSAVSS